jgi:hypothetical protein
VHIPSDVAGAPCTGKLTNVHKGAQVLALSIFSLHDASHHLRCRVSLGHRLPIIPGLLLRTAQVHRECGGRTARGNPAHRSSPLSMLAALADEDLDACAMAEARPTHHDRLAGEVAGAVDQLARR